MGRLAAAAFVVALLGVAFTVMAPETATDVINAVTHNADPAGGATAAVQTAAAAVAYAGFVVAAGASATWLARRLRHR